MFWGAANAMREVIGFALPAHERERQERELAEARRVLGEEAFSANLARGRVSTAEQAIALALGGS